MTWMTVPFVPLAVYGLVRTFRRDDLASQLWLAAPLAALWWAHSPIALWMTGIVAVSQVCRLALLWRRSPAYRGVLVRAGFGALVFAALAQYPFVSLASLHTPGTVSAVAANLPNPENITDNIQSVFPAILLPLSDAAGKLSDLQLGYGLWAVFLAVLAASFLARIPHRTVLRLLSAAVLALLVLLFPLPHLNPWLWTHIPEVIKRITYYWPMQRFYLIIAGILAFAGQLALDPQSGGTGERAPSPKPARHGAACSPLPAILLALACTWSLWESRQFIRAGLQRTSSAAVSDRALRPENLLLMNHSYGLFPALPPYFSNGVMDPEDETRLLALRTLAPLAHPSLKPAPTKWFRGTIDANPGILDLSPRIHLEPGKRYELEFAFGRRDYSGVLQLVGKQMFRQYLLPESGQPLAFGSLPGNSHTLPLWTTDPSGDEVTLRFIPTAPGAKPADYANFARFALRQRVPARQPAEILSLMPLRAAVRSPRPAYLETPRLFMPGYLATADGNPVPVARSPRGLAMIPVTPDVHRIVLRFIGTPLLRASYWLALTCWAALAIAACVRVALFTRMPPQA